MICPFNAGDRIAVFEAGYIYDLRLHEVHIDPELEAAFLLWRREDILEANPEIPAYRHWFGVHILLDQPFDIDNNPTGVRARYLWAEGFATHLRETLGIKVQSSQVYEPGIEAHSLSYPVTPEFGLDRTATLNTLKMHAAAERDALRKGGMAAGQALQWVGGRS